MILTPNTQQVIIRSEGQRVLVFHNGQLVLDMPYEHALAVAKGITVKARQIEESAKAEQIIADEAILARAGFPIGLTTRRDMAEEAAKEAHWDSKLRRYLPDNKFEKRGLVYAPKVDHRD